MRSSGGQRGPQGPLPVVSGAPRSQKVSEHRVCSKKGPPRAPSPDYAAWDRPGFLVKRLKTELGEETEGGGGPPSSRRVETIDLTAASDSSEPEKASSRSLAACRGQFACRVSSDVSEEERTTRDPSKALRRECITLSSSDTSEGEGSSAGHCPPRRRGPSAPDKGGPSCSPAPDRPLNQKSLHATRTPPRGGVVQTSADCPKASTASGSGRKSSRAPQGTVETPQEAPSRAPCGSEPSSPEVLDFPAPKGMQQRAHLNGGRGRKAAGGASGIERSQGGASQPSPRRNADLSFSSSPTLRRHLDPFYGSAGKIARVVLRDFCNHEHLDWRPSPYVNLILGRSTS